METTGDRKVGVVSYNGHIRHHNIVPSKATLKNTITVSLQVRSHRVNSIPNGFHTKLPVILAVSLGFEGSIDVGTLCTHLGVAQNYQPCKVG